MPSLMPYIRLVDRASGAAFTLVDNCYTMAMVGAGLASPRWSLGEVCHECCPTCLDQGVYSAPDEGGAWWSDVDNPAAGEFLGFLADTVTLENSLSSRRRGDSTLEPADYTPRRLEITGRFVTAGERGTTFAWDAFSQLLSQTSCSTGAGWFVEVRAFCPGVDEPTGGPVIEDWTPATEAPLVDVADECDPCRRQDPGWTPERLGPPIGVLDFASDSGFRKVMDVRLVSIDEADGDTPPCDGDDVTILLEVMSDDWFGDEIDAPCQLGDFADDAERCRPYDWSWSCRLISQGAGDGCGDDPLAEVAAGLVVPSSSTTGSTAPRTYCFPLWRRVRSCLIPAIPTRGDIGVNFDIFAGVGTDLRNLQVEVWEARIGFPDPSTCEGEQIYRAITPDAVLQVPWLPQHSHLRIDSASKAAYRSCYGRPFDAADQYISGWTHPKLTPGARYWIVATADCLNVNADTSILTSFTPRFRS